MKKPICLLLALGGVAHADEEFVEAKPVASTSAASSDEPKGVIDATVLTEISFNPDQKSQISISPDVWYRTMKYELGLYHSSLGLTGFHGLQAGSAICVRGDVCNRYAGAGLEGYYEVFHHDDGMGWESKTTSLLIGGGATVASTDPFAAGAKAGLKLRYMSGFALWEIEPSVLWGPAEFVDRFNVPVRISAATFIGLESGITSTFANAGDNWQIPLSIYGRYPLTDHVLAVAGFTFARIAGGESMSTGADAKTLTVGIELLHPR